MNFNESFQAFSNLLEVPKIRRYLENDTCNVIADKYILASIFIYFRRANFKKRDYSKRNFYLALYLAHEILEDIEDFKDDIVENYLGPQRQYMKNYHQKFLKDRFALLTQMNFNGIISKQLCDSLFVTKTHWVWSRKRSNEHSGVLYKHSCCKKCYLWKTDI